MREWKVSFTVMDDETLSFPEAEDLVKAHVSACLSALEEERRAGLDVGYDMKVEPA